MLRIDSESHAGILIGAYEGPMTVAEMKRCTLELWKQVSGPRLRILWDLRHARFDLDTSEVRDLAEFAKRGAPAGDLRTAFVVSGSLEFGLVRMFEVFREAPGAATSVFREIEPAVAWLSDGA